MGRKNLEKFRGIKLSKENSKIITASFVIVGILVWSMVGIFLDLASASFGAIARMQDVASFRHGIPVAVGVVSWLGLQMNSRVQRWADEVVSEMKKVIWPSRRDTSMSTIVVCFFAVIAAVVIGSYDMVSHYLINYIINL